MFISILEISVVGYSFIIFKLSCDGDILLFLQLRNPRYADYQPCIIFCSRLPDLPPKKPACSSAGSVKMQKPLGKCHKTWKPTTAHCPKDAWGSPATHSPPPKHDLSAETGHDVKILQCPVSTYLILSTLCDFLGLFLKLCILNISC